MTAITGISGAGRAPSGSLSDATAVSGWGGSMLGREDMGACANAVTDVHTNGWSETADDTADR